MESVKHKLKFDSWKAVIDQWPTDAAFAEDMEVPRGTAVCWKRRDKVPPYYWLRILAASKVRKLPVTAIDLIGLAASQPKREKPEGSGLK